MAFYNSFVFRTVPAASRASGCFVSFTLSHSALKSYNDPLAMVDLMLNDLRRPAGERLDARLKLLVLPLYLDSLVTLRFPRTDQG